MGDPLAAVRHIRQALEPDGTWLVVEPFAAGEAVIRRLTADAGFTRFRRAAETPFNLVDEVRP